MSELVWFRNDLRTFDQPALHAACQAAREHNSAVYALYLWQPLQWAQHGVAARRIAYQRSALSALRVALADLGIELRITEVADFSGSADAIVGLASSIGARRVHVNAEYPLNERLRDQAVAEALQSQGMELSVSHGGVLAIPGSVLTNDGRPYTVFTPFFRRWRSVVESVFTGVLPVPKAQQAVRWPKASETHADDTDSVLDDEVLRIEAGELPDELAHDEVAVAQQLEGFAERMPDYANARDLPAVSGTSVLSAPLSAGVLSPRQALAVAIEINGGRLSSGFAGDKKDRASGADRWIAELAWRDFYRHIIAAFDHVSRGDDFRSQFRTLRWRRDAQDLQRWQEGLTGIPFVDAGMRQLRETGWMHNRLRMVVASFLTKHLLIDWRLGEAWFMAQLIDGDFASNNGGWQWAASTGTDAQPYFRIFNPVTQGQRFDPGGEYIARFVPELARLPAKLRHEPWRAAEMPVGYPEPIVDLKAGRARALDAFKASGTKR